MTIAESIGKLTVADAVKLRDELRVIWWPDPKDEPVIYGLKPRD